MPAVIALLAILALSCVKLFIWLTMPAWLFILLTILIVLAFLAFMVLLTVVWTMFMGFRLAFGNLAGRR